MAAALAGLFAMHGLSEHGVMHHGTSSMSSMPADAMSAVSGVTLLEDTAVETMAAVGAGSAQALDQDAGMAMMLCLTVLAGLVVLLLRARGLWTGVLLRPATSNPDATIGRTSRDPDPPDLFVLSVQRC